MKKVSKPPLPTSPTNEIMYMVSFKGVGVSGIGMEVEVVEGVVVGVVVGIGGIVVVVASVVVGARVDSIVLAAPPRTQLLVSASKGLCIGYIASRLGILAISTLHSPPTPNWLASLNWLTLVWVVPPSTIW